MPVENRTCPACGNSNFSLFLNSRDYFLSGEEFSIFECTQCNLLVTSPVPDQQEIGKYYQSREYISHDAGQANLVSYIYKGARFFTLRSKYRIVTKFSTGNRLLDIGCGTGEFLNFCKQRGYECKGIEPNQGAREFASGNYGLAVREKIEFSETEKSGFDCITLWHVLEHIHDPAETLAQVRSVLKPGGTLVIALPNPGSWDARFYKEFWAAYDLPRHLYHFRPDNFKLLAGKYQFTLTRILPQKLDSFYVSLLSEKYRKRKLKLIRAFLNGLYSNFKSKKPLHGHSSLVYILTNKIS